MTVVDEYSGYSVEGVFKDEAEIRVGLEECLAKWEVAARKMVKGVNPAAAGTSVHRAASQQIAQGGGGAQAAAVGSVGGGGVGGEESGEGDSAEGEGGENPAAANPAVQEAISNTEAAKWKEAMDTEMDAMKEQPHMGAAATGHGSQASASVYPERWDRRGGGREAAL